MSDEREFPIPLATDADIADFMAREGKPYDPATDTYRREPFIADIREGKNDPIYNAHSYHTKVPPRAIIPYILHYTEPGDIILDPFCGSGMTGVAAMICEDPPEDILKTVPGAKKGARKAILNDLSPAACHIAYNYCTPVDVEALKAEFERIKGAVKEEFDWLYGTEHYEPAVGLYDPTTPEVACRLKNRPPDVPPNMLLPEDERTWELLDRGEVEKRTGADAANQYLPKGINWFISIPATIQHTVWSDVYRCEGMVKFEEPTGAVHRKTGSPAFRQVRRPRGCGRELALWDVAVDDGKVHEEFTCPTCGQKWKKIQLKRVKTIPVVTNYKYVGLKRKKQNTVLTTVKVDRPTTYLEREHIRATEEQPIPASYPTDLINTKGPQYTRNALSARNVKVVPDFYTKRNLRALAVWWKEAQRARADVRGALLFLVTSAFGRIERMTRYLFKVGGNCSLRGQLYFPSFSAEDNVFRQVESKFRHVQESYATLAAFAECSKPLITCAHAGRLRSVTDNSVDYVFTDPPFGSNIYYSEVNWLYESWLGKYTDSAVEAVVHRKNDRGTKTAKDYAGLMTKAFGEMYRVLKPGRYATIEFNNSDGQVFEAIKEAARSCGFLIENMLFLDKEQKTFKQIKGERGDEDVVGHDVIFNLRKPAAVVARVEPQSLIGGEEQDQALAYLREQLNGQERMVSDLVEQRLAETVREHLRTLPERIQKDPKTYSDEHRTTPFLNTMLMNALIPAGVDVSRLNLPFIEGVCARYFHKIDNRWYVPDEAVGNERSTQEKAQLFHSAEHEVVIQDETTAIAWLRQRLSSAPLRIGELRPHWMRATVKLTNDISTKLEDYLRRHFWLDRQTRRWREPTQEERAQMHNVEGQRAIHDAERFLADGLRPHPSDMEILGWIGHLYDSAAALEQEAIGLSDTGETTDLPEEAARLYRMIVQLLPSVLKENVEAAALTKAQRQHRIARSKLEQEAERQEAKKPRKEMSLFD